MEASPSRLDPSGVIQKECFDHLLILLRFQAAGAVHQDTAWANAQGRLMEQLKLFSGQPNDFLRLNAPAQFQASTKNSRVRTRSIHQDPIETLLKPTEFRVGLQLDSGNPEAEGVLTD
jgi:hypothetical protein